MGTHRRELCHLDVLACSHLAEARLCASRCLYSSDVDHCHRIRSVFCQSARLTRARTQVRVIDVWGVCVYGDDLAKGRVNVTGTVVATRAGAGGAEAYVRDLAGYPCRNFCLNVGLARHAGDTAVWTVAVEVACRNDCHTSVCPRRSPTAAVGPCRGRGLSPSRVRREPICRPCDGAEGGRLADGGRETCDDGRHLALGHDAV